MPELPEVETTVRDLRPMVVGQVVRAIRAGPQKLRTPWKPSWESRLIGRSISAIRRRGKWIILEFDTDVRMLVHLGMTGQLTAVSALMPRQDHTHLVFAFADGDEMRFRDVRRFGSATVFDTPALLDRFLDERLGPEPFQMDPDRFREIVQSAQRSLKAILLDQTVVAGVGNIYADESCFRARLHPGRTGASLTNGEIDRLREAIGPVLTAAIELRGATLTDGQYIGGSGLRGRYQNEFAVYGRTGKPCVECASPVQRVVLAGRSSHFCPVCQPQSRARRPSSISRKSKRS